MYSLQTAIAALLSLQTVFASPVRHPKSRTEYAIKEAHFVPRGWTDVGKPHPNQKLDLKIGLKNKNFAVLEQHLFDISHPTHHRYRQHFSKEEVDELVRPDEDVSALVDEWLLESGVEPWRCKYSSARDWISVSLPVDQVETLLDTKYSTFRNEDGSTLVRTTRWSLPKHLHDHISTIQPTTAFLRAAPQLQTVVESPDADEDLAAYEPNPPSLIGQCNWEGVTPACLRLLYGTSNYTAQSPESQIAFTNYLGEVASRTDAAAFLSQFRREAVEAAQTHKQISIDGGPIDNGTAKPGKEGNLDLQTILGQVFPLSVTAYGTGGSPPFQPDLKTPKNTNEPYLTWLDYVLNSESIPQTITTSYGDDEQTVPPSYAQAVCEGFAQLGLRGVSLLFSSGDFGVGSNGTCVSNDGKNTTMFVPAFPASCPYVTTVGGTKAYPEVVAYDARNGYVSGSGFSNYFAQPAYQKDSGVVDKYIESLGGKHDGLYNKSGRAYPDLAAQGYRYIVMYNSSVVTLDGTSASAPTIASIISLVNDALMTDGQKPLGFLNPWLYTVAGKQAFTDIVSGNSSGCNGEGFHAAEGWDVASGWGTPRFPDILDVLGLGAQG